MLQVISCDGCEEEFTFSLDPLAIKAWEGGVAARLAFPELSIEESELLDSGFCDRCWEEMTPEEDDETNWIFFGGLDPYSDFPEYNSDYYVDQDCD